MKYLLCDNEGLPGSVHFVLSAELVQDLTSQYRYVQSLCLKTNLYQNLLQNSCFLLVLLVFPFLAKRDSCLE